MKSNNEDNYERMMMIYVLENEQGQDIYIFDQYNP